MPRKVGEERHTSRPARWGGTIGALFIRAADDLAQVGTMLPLMSPAMRTTTWVTFEQGADRRAAFAAVTRQNAESVTDTVRERRTLTGRDRRLWRMKTRICFSLEQGRRFRS